VQTVSSTTVRKALKSNSADMQAAGAGGTRRGGAGMDHIGLLMNTADGRPPKMPATIHSGEGTAEMKKLSSELKDMQPALPDDLTSPGFIPG